MNRSLWGQTVEHIGAGHMIGRFRPSANAKSAEPKSFDDFELRLGDIMRGERATLGKSLLDVQRELKIKATYIAAIENSDPSAFETPGFIAGYVRSYARYLGLESEWAYENFCAESGFETAHGMSSQASTSKSGKNDVIVSSRAAKDPFADPNATFVPRAEAIFSRIEPGALGSVAVLLGLIGAIGFGGWTVLQEVQRVQFSPVAQASGGADTLDPLAEIAATAEHITPTSEALDRLYRPAALDVPVLVARDGPIAAVDPNSLGVFAQNAADRIPELIAMATQAVADAETPVQVVETGSPDVVLVAVRPAWVRVRGAGGTVLFEKVLNAGEEYVLPQTDEPPTLRVGESGAVYFAMNGQHYGPAGPDGTVTKDIVLSGESLSDAYAVADLSQDGDLARMVAQASAVTQGTAAGE